MFLRRLCRRDTIKFSEKLLDRYRFPEFGNYHFYTSRAASSSQQIASDIYRSDEDEANVNWEELGFGIVPTDYMYVMKCSKEDRFSEGKLNRFGNIEMSPSAGVLNYGQEGLSPINLFVDDEFHRATPGGTGGVKTISNYAPVLKAQALAKSKGFSDVLYLDSINKRNLEEASSCNVFIVKNDVISTPTIEGTILPGITRKSIIEICPHYGYQIQERPVSVEELMDADEVFCTGTAVVIAPVGSIMYHGKRVEYRSGVETVSQKLYSALTSIQMGLVEDKMGWTVEID
ncbi:branched-chain amino acid aminotransferase 2, chloroplastic-like isoform X4 [Magnolia sinica]|uniref:branched-chain amino acid aminotransferase 2, chloroplastic-like isoform X4 n=1 Tax=Magnolia sinica TaxID=86752 RepID=UPI00265AFDBE|nr:branched-chain amino acid aminotransferase 2, chloroplastic-like isoform X4 [Magnolia sinica]